MSVFTLAVLGCGSRGRIYSGIAAGLPEKFKVVAACDPVPERTAFVQEKSGYADFKEFSDAESFFAAGKLADALMICTQDTQHFEQATRAMDMGYDILLEKPIAPTHEQTLFLAEQAKRLGRKVVVCHVLRYAPFYIAMRDIIASGEIGEIVNFEAMEGVEPWHMAHSFVRGHWSRPDKASPTVVAKSCHDMDMLAWVLDRPCESVSAVGSLSRFTEKHAPAGAPARCTDGCPVGDTCFYNSNKYTGEMGRRWLGMVNDKPDAPADEIMAWLKTSAWGRCVYRCDNTAPDHISAAMKFAGEVTGTFTLTAFDFGRQYAFFGTKGVLRGGPAYKKMTGADILVQPHGGAEPRRVVIPTPVTGHGGGDSGIVNALYDELTGAGDGRTSIARSVQSHAMAFAAEHSRVTGKTVEIRDNRF
jgi:predicted dehydrogenase